MADNVAITEGSGKSVATDDVSGQQYQRIKLDLGTDGAAAPAVAGAGAVSTGVQRITLASDDPAVALLGTIDTDTGVIAGDTTSIDGKITACNTGAVVISSGTVTTVSTVTNLAQMGGVAISLNEGVLGTGVQRVSLATDDDAVTSLGIIDDWDESDRAKVNPIVGQAGVQGAEGTITALTQRVTLATDDDGVAHLATIAGDTTSIDGKITACNTGAVVISSGTVTTVSTVTNLAQLGGTAISMNEGVLDAGVQRVSLATDDDAVASLGIIDDWDATHGSAPSADGPQLMAAYDATKPTAVTDNQAVRVLADEYGRLLPGVEKTAWQEDYDSADASGEGEAVKASAASTILVVQSYIISVDTEMWVKLQEEDSSALTGKFWLKAGGGVAITLPDNAPLVLGVDSDLEVISEGAGDVSVSATGYTIPG